MLLKVKIVPRFTQHKELFSSYGIIIIDYVPLRKIQLALFLLFFVSPILQHHIQNNFRYALWFFFLSGKLELFFSSLTDPREA